MAPVSAKPRSWKTVLAGAAMGLLSATASELGAPYNQPWQELRPNERIELIDSQPPSPLAPDDKRAAGVDGITGYKSINFGDRIGDLADRLRRKRNGNLVEPLTPDGRYVVRRLYPGEETYGGLPVEVRVEFLSGRVWQLEIAFLASDTAPFVFAFRQKYGAPNVGSNRWRGTAIEYWLDQGANGGLWAKITSLQVQNQIKAEREAERARQQAKASDDAKKIQRDF